LVALIQLLKSHGKNLSNIGWALWWSGYYAAPNFWRDRLILAAEMWRRMKSAFPACDELEDPSERVLQDISATLSKRKNAGPLIGAVKRHAPKQIESIMALVLSVLNGSYLSLKANSHDTYEIEVAEKLLSKSLSIPVTDNEKAGSETHFPTSVEALDGKFLEISEFAKIDVAGFVASQSDTEIQDARSELSLFMLAVSAIETTNQQKLGVSSGAKPILWSNQDPTGQANILVGWLLMRRNPVMRENVRALNAQIRNLVQLAEGGTNVA
jgi:hypothetical protein